VTVVKGKGHKKGHGHGGGGHGHGKSEAALALNKIRILFVSRFLFQVATAAGDGREVTVMVTAEGIKRGMGIRRVMVMVMVMEGMEGAGEAGNRAMVTVSNGFDSIRPRVLS
jgi:hypothetical protein